MAKMQITFTPANLKVIGQVVGKTVDNRLRLWMPNEKQLDYIETRFRSVFATKEDFTQFKSDIMDKFDKALEHLEAIREEMTVAYHKSEDHEGRIQRLESFHPVN